MIQHVYPVNDLEEHDITSTSIVSVMDDVAENGDRIIMKRYSFCKCNPSTKYITGNETIIVHNSFDGREGLELANEILNK